MREFVVNKNDADQRVDKYLSKSLKRLPKSLMLNSWILHLCRHQSCRMWFMKMIIY